MNGLNQLVLEGNLVKKPELDKTPSGQSASTFALAVNRRYKTVDGQIVDEVSCFDIYAYGKLADYIAAKADKGQWIRLVGRLEQNRWKDSKRISCSNVKGK